MARSWRRFFRRSTDEEQENGPVVANEPGRSTEDAEESTGHLDAEVESLVEVPPGGEVQGEGVLKDAAASRLAGPISRKVTSDFLA